MADYEDLFRNVELARRNTSAFYKVDLHIHSHESPDFPKLGDKLNCASGLTTNDYNANPQGIFAAAKAVPHLRLMAITDHNFSRVAAEITRLSDSELAVLPGMEVSLQATIFPDSRVHILAIFPEECSSEDIDHVFPPACGMPKYDQRTPDSVAVVPIDAFIDSVHKNDGICIAGHVNSSEGIRTLFRDSHISLAILRRELGHRKEEGSLTPAEERRLGQIEDQISKLEDSIQRRYLEFLSTYQFDAVEVQRSGDDQFYSGIHTAELGIRPIACVLGSDARNLQDIGLQGSSTYAKMTRPRFRDLRRALQDPGARIRYEDTVQRPRNARILGIRFTGGFFDGQTLGFSDNLTCLIGGRGVGKSAAIEAIRYMFERKVDHLPPRRLLEVTERREHTLAGTVAEVQFTGGEGDTLVLGRAYGDARTVCYDADGTRMDEVNVATRPDLDIRVFGWGEIEELARNNREQLALVDGFAPESTAWKSQLTIRLEKLKANTHDIIERVEDIGRLLPEVADLPEKESALTSLSTPELNAIFEEYDRNQAAKASMDTLGAEIAGLRALFTDATGELHQAAESVQKATALALPTLGSYGWYDEFRATMLAKTTELHDRYAALVKSFDSLLNEIANRIGLLEHDHGAIEDKLNEYAKASKTDVQGLISRRRRLTREVLRLREIQRQIEEKQKTVDEKLTERFEEIVPNLESARASLTEVRQARVVAINQKLTPLRAASRVSIELWHQGEREPFRIALGAPDNKAPDGILKGVNHWYKAHDYAGLYSSIHTPHTFVRAILDPQDYSTLRAGKSDEHGIAQEIITGDRARQVAEHLSPYIEQGKPHFDSAKLEQLLDLEHLDIEDRPIVCLGDKAIAELSPGQRCSALLPIILLEGRSPLIIDQPEDNLDSKLVFDLVVDILRGLKEHRQIIVATHNPNIPVSGDAEQIIVLESASLEQCTVACQGSIDEDSIIQQVKAIMEGSEEAFRIRAQKYGYRLHSVHP